MTECTAACDAEKAVLVEALRRHIDGQGDSRADGMFCGECGARMTAERIQEHGLSEYLPELHEGWCLVRQDVLILADTPSAAAALLAQGERHKRALVAQVEAHDYRFGPEGEAAETAEELNTFMATAQGLDEEAWRLTCAALSGEEHAHVWIDARNEVVKAGEMCACGAIRAGNKSSGESPSRDS